MKYSKSQSKLAWGNKTGTLRWNHLFNSKIFSNTSLIHSDYNFRITNVKERNNDVYELKYDSGIKDQGLKYDIQYDFSPKYTIKAGFSSTVHEFNPSAIVLKNRFYDQDQIELTKETKIT